MQEKTTNSVRSVERALDIIEVLAGERGKPKGVTEIAQKLNLAKSTVHRLLDTLLEKGYVEQDSDSEKYRLGLKLVEIGNIVLNNLELRSQALPYLKRLMEKSGQTVHLAILDHGDVVYIDKVESTGAIKMASYIGLRGYVHSTALGKAIAAFMSEEQVKHILETKGMPRLTPNTITSFPEFMVHLERIRQQGYAVDDIENEEAIRCIAAPIFNHSGKVVAAVSVSGMVLQITMDRVAELAQMVIECGEKISTRLGYISKKVVIDNKSQPLPVLPPTKISSNEVFNVVNISSNKLPLTVVVGTSLGNAITFSAVEKGIFEKYGIDLRINIVPNGFHQINIIESEDAQFGQAGVVPIALMKAKGVNVIGLGLLQGAAYTRKMDNDLAIISIKDSNIREQHPEDLAGKIIGVSLGTVAHEYLWAVLKEKSIPEEAVRMVDLRDLDLLKALASRKVNAIICWEALASSALKKLPDCYLVQRGGGYINRSNIIISSSTFIGENPDFAELYITAFCEASQWVRQHLDEAATIASRWISDLDPGIARLAIRNISFDPRISKFTYAGIKESLDFLLATQKIDVPLDIKSFFNAEIMQHVMQSKKDLFDDLPPIPSEAALDNASKFHKKTAEPTTLHE